jgi:hypothetical protein
MAINFPASPTLNQTFSSGNVNYVWDGTKWTASVTGGISLDKIEEGDTKAEVIDTGSNGRFVVTTEGAERLRVDSSGRLGVGTTSPSFKLHSYDTAAAQGFFNGWSSGGTYDAAGAIRFGNQTGYQGRVDYDPSGNTNFIFENSYSNGAISWKIYGGEKARLTPTGQLLVGTSSTSTTCTSIFQGNASGYYSIFLLAANTATPTTTDPDFGQIRFTDSGHGTAASIIGARDGGTWSASSKPTRLVFSTTADGASSPTERMRITSAGAFKITNTGSYAVGGLAHEINQSASNVGVLEMYHSSASTPYGIYQKFTAADPNNTTQYVFKAEQNTGVNIYTIWSNGTVSARSDARYKKNVESARNGYLEDIAQLRVVKYNWYNHDDEASKELGFIAQEVEQVFPGLVMSEPEKDEDGNETGEFCKSIKTSVFTPILVKALQEAHAKIEQLEARLSALEGV